MKKCRHAVLPLVLFSAAACLPATAAEKIPLQYHPKVGEKRTLRVNYNLATTNPTPSGQECTEHIRTFTLEVEPMSIAGDGSVVTRIGFLTIYRKSFQHSNGWVVEEYDSTQDLYKSNVTMGDYRSAVGAGFTVVTSASGKIVKLNLDAFYDAVARNRMKCEDEDIQEMPKRRAAEMLKDLQERYGSPEKRRQAYIKEAPSSIMYKPEELQVLANTVLVPFAPEPVPGGGVWKAPIMVSIEAPMELTGTYTLKTVEPNVCTIRVEAQRTSQDKVLGAPAAVGSKLSGPYEATLRVDRATGCLLAREEEMNLTGDLFMPGHSAAKPDGSIPVTTKATTTVAEVREPPSLPQPEQPTVTNGMKMSRAKPVPAGCWAWKSGSIR